MRFGMLGSLAVWSAEGQPVTVPELKTRALLADLLVHADQVVSSERLIDDVWGDQLPHNPANALQGKVSQLRRALESAEAGGRDLVVSRAPGYVLRIPDDGLDAQQFQRLLTLAQRTDVPRAKAALLADALALWRGPVLADFADAGFVRSASVGLEEQRLMAIEEQAAARLELGEHRLLVGELSDLVDRYPLRERLRALHMRALYRSGRQNDALASYGDLRERLRDELGLDPSAPVAALHQAILRQDASLTVPVAPAVTVRPSLPTPVTELVGRAEAAAEVASLLKTNRFVTLTGPGGVGKTRLALEVATRAAETLADGVYLVELAAAERPGAPGTDSLAECEATVAEMVLTAMGIRDDPRASNPGSPGSTSVTERLAGVFADRQVLLILDNCEHVIDAVAGLAEVLLTSAAELRIVATSQEPLRASGEVVWLVPPLELPDPAAGTDPAVLRRSPAVDLFVARAAAAAPGFVLDAGNADAVATICRRLDGIPLGLELAAARVSALGVHELAARLDDRLQLLTAGRRHAPPRQRTLRAMIDWSWELLTDDERTVLRRLAVQPGGSTLPAAEAICGDDRVAAGSVPDVLARLVDRSLVTVAHGPRGERRFRLLETVQAYCVQRLEEAGELPATRRRQLRFYTELAERAEPHLYGVAQRQWLERLDAETANLRAALDGAAQLPDSTLGLRLSNALTWYWVLRGRLGELGRSLGTALAVPGSAPATVRSRAVVWRAALAFGTGAEPDWAGMSDEVLSALEDLDDPLDRARAEWALGYCLLSVGSSAGGIGSGLLEQSLTTFRATGDRWGMAAALVVRGSYRLRQGAVSSVARDGEQAMAWFEELGDQWGVAMAASLLGERAILTGDFDEAARLYRTSLRISEELGLWADACFVLCGLGQIAWLTGDNVAAKEFFERARRLAGDHFIKVAMELAEVGLGGVARRDGELDTAEVRLRGWLDWNRGIQAHDRVAHIQTELGFVAVQRGDVEAALGLFGEGLDAARRVGDPWLQTRALEGMAGAYMLAGQHDDAARRLEAAAGIRSAAHVPVAPAEQAELERLNARVGAARRR
ncbi:BTAD domain-containing putative transcriptional regulator [Phytoactinopolyspora mesophila]|uniref:Tetratricopeptide repeat protein n=1 Tax=Phytoactinopolyspora mesophila TaxID=2650750 RepID=A0A7K3M5R6_9ACTN|nr:BTAD domain-containing putative transcriptional regulator [Phytoactinopolyspora mesophila]NDL58664.1 tetratricopeptide repeat protein [Phytoactinopolyspora mesophila]